MDVKQELLALGFEPDLGPALGLDLPDGTTILVAALGPDGEPEMVGDGDEMVFAQHLRDPWDHDTLIRSVERPTLSDLLADVRRWILEAS